MFCKYGPRWIKYFFFFFCQILFHPEILHITEVQLVPNAIFCSFRCSHQKTSYFSYSEPALVQQEVWMKREVREQMSAEPFTQVARLMPRRDSLQHLSAVPFLLGWRTKHAAQITRRSSAWLKALMNIRHSEREREKQSERERERETPDDLQWMSL